MNHVANELNTQLKSMYADWKAGFDRTGIATEDFSPPLLLSAPAPYIESPRKLMVVGQETFGWSWTRDLREQFPEYPSDYEFADLSSLRDFLDNPDAVDALCWGYDQFAFAKYQPINFRSPFWRAFRQIGNDDRIGTVWTNMLKSDFQGGTILQLPDADRQPFLAQQNKALRAEVDILKPDGIVFLTGPNYDPFLQALFPGVVFRPVEGQKMLAALEHPALPPQAFRTYHPGFLVRSGLWGQIDFIRTEILRD